MSTIEEIASAHLGKTSDGATMKRYETPMAVDPSLLVAIPRHLNREEFGITDKDFVGYDVWHAFEFSYMLHTPIRSYIQNDRATTMPHSSVLKIVYPSNSKYIVESKSLKLYLNSFNFAMFNGLYEATDRIRADLSDALQIAREKIDICDIIRSTKQGVPVEFGINFAQNNEITDAFSGWTKYENQNYFDKSNAVSFVTHNLRSNCRVTNQPDWGSAYIYMSGDKIVNPANFEAFLLTQRDKNHFHEEMCEVIFKELTNAFDPTELFVACLYTRRGGIDINPVRASNPTLFNQIAAEYCAAKNQSFRTFRQ